jgi:hypothetical protein
LSGARHVWRLASLGPGLLVLAAGGAGLSFLGLCLCVSIRLVLCIYSGLPGAVCMVCFFCFAKYSLANYIQGREVKPKYSYFAKYETASTLGNHKNKMKLIAGGVFFGTKGNP